MHDECEARTARPFLVLSTALVCEISAGMLYWWPALTPGLQHHLNLSEAQAVTVVATANSGSVLGILGGVFHARFGSRLTAAAGAAGISACFACLAMMVAAGVSAEQHKLVFPVVLLIALSMVTFSYMLYSACLTAAAAMFPTRFRGRVVGLCTAMYGASAAVYATIQAAAFPSLKQTHAMLLFFTAFSSIPVLLTAVSFPDKETYEVGIPQAAHSPSDGYSSVASNDAAEGSAEHQSDIDIKPRLGLAYKLTWALVISLQAAALVDVLGMSISSQQVCAACVVAGLIGLGALSVRSRLSVRQKEISLEAADEPDPLPPFVNVAKDRRYIYLCMGFLATVGGGGVAVLVQAPNLVSSRIYLGADPSSATVDAEAISRAVRTLVAIFSACNVTARLGVGSVMDRGEGPVERHMWKYDIMVTDTIVMACALLGIGFSRSWLLFMAVGLVGFCHGTWFSSTPALTTLWFGVQSFPRNYALVGPFAAVGTATLASTIPALLRNRFGNWIELPGAGDIDKTMEVCNTLMCSIPTFSLLAVIQLAMFLCGKWMRNYSQGQAEACGY